MKTRDDLIRSVIGLLGEAWPGEVATDDDRATVDLYIDGKFEELANRQIFYVQDASAIEDRVFLPLSKIIANAVGPHFKVPFSDDVDAREEWRLRDIDRSPAVYDTLATDYI